MTTADLEQQLQRLSRRVTRPVALSPGAPLDLADYRALGCLVDQGPMRLTALAAALRVDLSVVSRQVRSLADSGLATRAADPADARAALVGASDAGRCLLLTCRTQRREVLARTVAGWSARDRARFVDLLTRFNDSLDAAVGSGTRPAPKASKPRLEPAR